MIRAFIVWNYKTFNFELPIWLGSVKGYHFRDGDWDVHIRQEPGSSPDSRRWEENQRTNRVTGECLNSGNGW